MGLYESSLTLAYNDLQGEVGHFLGYGRGTPFGDEAWTTSKATDITVCVNSGLRRFYFSPLTTPSPGSPNQTIHNWSFLKPYITVDLVMGASVVQLPPDFGGLEGSVTVSQANQTGYWPLRLVNPEVIVQNFAAFPTATGRPTICALQVKPPVGGQTSGTLSSSKYMLMIYPFADLAYSITFQYYLLPDAITQNYIFPFGGTPHSESIKAAVRAAAEKFLDNMAGPEEENYQMCLVASIAYDRKYKAHDLGYNHDRSDRLHRAWGGGVPWWAWGRYGYGTITIAGQNPG